MRTATRLALTLVLVAIFNLLLRVPRQLQAPGVPRVSLVVRDRPRRHRRRLASEARDLNLGARWAACPWLNFPRFRPLHARMR